MTGLIGHGSLFLALLLAACGMVSPILWARTGRDRFFTATLGAILAQFVLVTLAGLALVYALVATDLSIKYVAMNTTRATPIYYRVTGLWGALEGSLLLWEWILVIFAALVAWQYRSRERELLPWVLFVFSGVSVWALAFTRPLLLLLIPFATVVWLRTRGRSSSGPQWPWLPPALFLAGFSLTFVVAISGTPDLVAQGIYRAHKAIEVALGGLLVLWGALVAIRVPALIEARSGWWAAGLGIATGLLFYHELDPSYDSVLFATGNAVASSHAPLTVVMFSTALSVLYLAAAAQASRWRLPAARTLAGSGTALVGVAVAGGWLETVRALVLQ